MADIKPNILWIFSDQHRAHALSCYGDENVETPNLDRLAKEGIRFENAYANTPVCTPFRASLYTGKYITSHGVICLQKPLLPDQIVLPMVLKQYGYHTSHMGKWHLSGGVAPNPFVSPYFRPGWDDWAGWENSNRPWETDYTDGEEPRKVKRLEGYQTDAVTDLTVEWIKKQPANRPWFHVMSIEPPHPPNTAPDQYMQMFQDKPLKLRRNVPQNHPRFAKFEHDLRAYYAQIANLDDNVGKIIAALEETGQLDQTIIFYFSDHGDLMGSHGMMGKSRPEEESSNIPLMIRYPNRVPQGKVSSAYISGVDLMPTLLGMIGAPIPDGVDGQDLSETVMGNSDVGAECVLLQYEHTHYPNTYSADVNDQAFRTILHNGWNYTFFWKDRKIQLFNMNEDPYQLRNLAGHANFEDKQKQLHDMLVHKLNELNDDFFGRISVV
jgi:arylsulfatase A-like enzyme